MSRQCPFHPVSDEPMSELFRVPVPLAAIIIGRDVLLSLSAFYIRYTSLPAPVRPLPLLSLPLPIPLAPR